LIPVLDIKTQLEGARAPKAAPRFPGSGRAADFGSMLSLATRQAGSRPATDAAQTRPEQARKGDAAPAKDGGEDPLKAAKKKEALVEDRVERPASRRARRKAGEVPNGLEAAQAALTAPVAASRPVGGLEQKAAAQVERDNTARAVGAGAASSSERPAATRRSEPRPDNPSRTGPEFDARFVLSEEKVRSRKTGPGDAEDEKLEKTALKVRDLRSGRIRESTTPVERPLTETVRTEEVRREPAREAGLSGAVERDAQPAAKSPLAEHAPEGAADLRRQLREETNLRVVREAAVVLRDHDQGEIRLVLKPDNLGRVRIKLDLRENRIDGTIYVENGSIREIFEQNLPDLMRAFRESGFELGSFNVAVGGEHRRQRQEQAPRDTRHVEAKAAPLYERGASPFEQNVVNIVV
jgi:flagellar hook-length control protein FliK